MTNNKISSNILVINPFPIFPVVSGGQNRVFHLFKQVSFYYDVTILCLANHRETKQLLPHLKQICVPKSIAHIQAELKFYQKTQLPGCPILPCISSLTPELSYQINLQATNSNLIVLSHPYLYYEVAKLNLTLPFIYDAHNVELVLMSALLPPQMSIILRQIYNIEKLTCQNSQLISVCSNDDILTFCDLYNLTKNKFLTVSNGAAIEPTLFTSRKQCQSNQLSQNISRPRVLFMASNHLPNLVASEVVISIAKKLPKIDFFLMGSQCFNFKSADLPANVSLLGVITEQEKMNIFKTINIALNPVVTGSGTNIKMFEYMAAGIPIITTKFGARGIDGKNGQHFIVSNLENMADRISELLNYPTYLEYISTQALSLVTSKYSWDIIAKNYINSLDMLLNKGIDK